MKILHLTVTKQWFDLIASGEKKEEYRTIKPYWTKRLTDPYNFDKYKHFDIIRFKNGYAKDAPSMDVQLEFITIGLGMTIWGAEPDTEYFILSLGKILSHAH